MAALWDIHMSLYTSEVVTIFIILADNASENLYFATENYSKAFTMNGLFDSR